MSAARIPLSDTQAAAVERGRRVALNVEVYRARLRADMEAICDIGGFPALVKATQGELRSLQALILERGGDLGGWVV